MKSILLIFIFFAVIGCKDKISNETNRSNIGQQYTVQKLPSTKPIIINNIKDILGENIGDFRRVSSSIGYSNLNLAELVYTNEEQRLTVSITDGAGAEGAKLVALIKPTMDAKLNIKTKDGYLKSTTIQGVKAVEEKIQKGEMEQSKLTFLVNRRFLVSLVGNSISNEQLRKIANDTMIIEKLQNFVPSK